VAPTATTGPSIGIVALNKSGPHEILGGGTVSSSSRGHLPQHGGDEPAVDRFVRGPHDDGQLAWDDAIDAKTSSNLYVYARSQQQRHVQW